MRKIKIFQSLRTQLPFFFAVIALLTTTLIGVVLLFIIWSNYSDVEKKYLDSNVRGTANSLSRIAENAEISPEDNLLEYQDVFQNQARVTAFLAQCRVRILDAQGNLVADSGPPSRSWKITVPRPRAEGEPPPQPDSESGDQSAFSIEPSENQPPQNDNPPAYSFQANPNMFGYLLMQDTSDEYHSRSSAVVAAPFHDPQENILGYVELSESPQYGRQIIDNVIQGWGIASLIGVAVSTLFGFLASRGLIKPLVNLEQVAGEMKEGNYAIRSPIFKPQEMASLSETFNQMAQRIEQNIETLRRFVSDAAHEIRTPLTALRADLNLALSEKRMKDTQPLIHRSLEQVEKLDRLSRDLLDLSRLESRNEKIDKKKLNLNELLLEISEIHASAAEQAEIEFNLHLPDSVIFIEGQAAQLQQAVSNLLSNAVKFTPTGGKVSLNLKSEPKTALILVEDNGIGIPVEEWGEVFNRFHRGRNTQKYPGSGLGLAIARAIVEKHNGTIGILPEKKRTIFFIRLPLSEIRGKKS